MILPKVRQIMKIELSLSGLIKAIHCGNRPDCNRITKDTVIFHAADFPKLVEKLQLDLHEPPMSQASLYTLHFTDLD